ncbi:hypothetical protein O1L44_14085 [Streptomyces noursei]|uniref:hypothetical protein n=1 Tax=Streptomyces noursei TaxID=1971 RepID=UPI0013520871|nr:hypothetical protein [Streptomyces noursei]
MREDVIPLGTPFATSLETSVGDRHGRLPLGEEVVGLPAQGMTSGRGYDRFTLRTQENGKTSEPQEAPISDAFEGATHDHPP